MIQRTLPSARASAISLPFTSTTKTASPADHGICVLVTFLVHSRSPDDSDTAIILPPWPTTNTTPRSITGRAGSARMPAAVVSLVRDSESLQAGCPLPTS